MSITRTLVDLARLVEAEDVTGQFGQGKAKTVASAKTIASVLGIYTLYLEDHGLLKGSVSLARLRPALDAALDALGLPDSAKTVMVRDYKKALGFSRVEAAERR